MMFFIGSYHDIGKCISTEKYPIERRYEGDSCDTQKSVCISATRFSGVEEAAASEDKQGYGYQKIHFVSLIAE